MIRMRVGSEISLDADGVSAGGMGGFTAED